jgi:hypothetical protein
MRSGVGSNTAIVPSVLIVAGGLLDEIVNLDHVGILPEGSTSQRRARKLSISMSANLFSKLVGSTVDANNKISATNSVAATWQHLELRLGRWVRRAFTVARFRIFL